MRPASSPRIWPTAGEDQLPRGVVVGNHHLARGGCGGKPAQEFLAPVGHHRQHAAVQIGGRRLHQLPAPRGQGHRRLVRHHARGGQGGDLPERVPGDHVGRDPPIDQPAVVAERDRHQQRLQQVGPRQKFFRAAQAEGAQVPADQRFGVCDQGAEALVLAEQVGGHPHGLGPLAGIEECPHGHREKATVAESPPSTTRVWPTM